jgi:hypothetical protein
MRDRRKVLISLLLRALGSFLLANVLLLYVPVSLFWLGLVTVVAGAALLLSPSRSVPLAVSLTMTTLVLELVVRLGLGGLTPYYRPHERLALETSYRPRQHVEMAVPHGDLLAIDPRLPRSLATPRREVFITDSFGYRNEQDYGGERLVLIGDSFLVGTDTTLAGYLRTGRATPAYNLSFASIGPLIYTDKLRWARRQLPADTCIALYFFEGNDFQLVDPAELARRQAVPRGVQLAVKNYVQAVRGRSEWSKAFFGLTTRSAEAFRRRPAPDQPSEPPPDLTFVRTVEGRPIAFLKGYADVVRRASFDDHGFISSQLSAEPPDMVFFIPDKFRVYSALVDQDAEPALPHAQWEYLQRATSALGIPAVDLTPYLIERSRELAASGEATFWPDDTHWNRHGEKVAADVLMATLASSTSPRCASIVTSTQ